MDEKKASKCHVHVISKMKKKSTYMIFLNEWVCFVSEQSWGVQNANWILLIAHSENYIVVRIEPEITWDHTYFAVKLFPIIGLNVDYYTLEKKKKSFNEKIYPILLRKAEKMQPYLSVMLPYLQL